MAALAAIRNRCRSRGPSRPSGSRCASQPAHPLPSPSSRGYRDRHSGARPPARGRLPRGRRGDARRGDRALEPGGGPARSHDAPQPGRDPRRRRALPAGLGRSGSASRSRAGRPVPARRSPSLARSTFSCARASAAWCSCRRLRCAMRLDALGEPRAPQRRALDRGGGARRRRTRAPRRECGSTARSSGSSCAASAGSGEPSPASSSASACASTGRWPPGRTARVRVGREADARCCSALASSAIVSSERTRGVLGRDARCSRCGLAAGRRCSPRACAFLDMHGIAGDARAWMAQTRAMLAPLRLALRIGAGAE